MACMRAHMCLQVLLQVLTVIYERYPVSLFSQDCRCGMETTFNMDLYTTKLPKQVPTHTIPNRTLHTLHAHTNQQNAELEKLAKKQAREIRKASASVCARTHPCIRASVQIAKWPHHPEH